MKKFVKNPPFSAGMQAITERMKSAAGMPTRMEKEGRAIMARSAAAKAAKAKPLPGTLDDPDWRRDERKMSNVEYRALQMASEEIRPEKDGGTYDEAVGMQIRGLMNRPYKEPETWCPGYSKADPLARTIVAFRVMASEAGAEAGLERPGTPENAYKEWDDAYEELGEFGRCYSLLTGVGYDTGRRLEMSNHQRMEAMRNEPRQDLLTQAKAYRKDGKCEMMEGLEKQARKFCGAFDERAKQQLPASHREKSTLRVKRRDKQSVR